MFVAILFLVRGIDILLGLHLERFGIVPRTLSGVVGVFFSPLLHGNMHHLLANSVPLFVLLVILLSNPKYQPYATLGFIWIASGLGTVADRAWEHSPHRRQFHRVRLGRLLDCGRSYHEELALGHDCDFRFPVLRRHFLRSTPAGGPDFLGRSSVRSDCRGLARQTSLACPAAGSLKGDLRGLPTCLFADTHLTLIAPAPFRMERFAPYGS
jgi:hypothetical protein